MNHHVLSDWLVCVSSSLWNYFFSRLLHKGAKKWCHRARRRQTRGQGPSCVQASESKGNGVDMDKLSRALWWYQAIIFSMVCGDDSDYVFDWPAAVFYLWMQGRVVC